MAAQLLVRPTNGLCNRLGVISSFSVLARRAGRDLQVCWTPSAGWSDETLDELFEHRLAMVGRQVFDVQSIRGLALHQQVSVSGTGGRDETWSSTGPGVAAVFDTVAHPVVTFHGFRPAHTLLAPEDRRRLLPGFKREWEAELRALRPVRELRDRVAEIAAEFDAATVGVHIRRGDAAHHPRFAAEFLRSSDEAFRAQMERIIRRRPGTRFFLATDSEETQAEFQSLFGPRVLVNPEKTFVPSVSGEPKSNQRDAVIDLFALARTGMLLGNYYSSFSQTAAMIGGIKLRVARDDSWLTRARLYARYSRHEVMRRLPLELQRKTRPDPSGPDAKVTSRPSRGVH